MSDSVKHYDCSDLPENNIVCCMSCHDDDYHGYSELSQFKDLRGNIWHICCRQHDSVPNKDNLWRG